MKTRLSAALVTLCLTLTLCPAGATDAGAAVFRNKSLEGLLNEYFQTILTRGLADYDCEYDDFLLYMSETVLENAIMRVEQLNEAEKAVSRVSYAVTERNEEAGTLTADVTETVDGQTFTTTHKLRVRDGQRGGWFIEADSYADAVLNLPGVLKAQTALVGGVTPSQSHKNTWNNTGNQAEDITQIAQTQIGYAETSVNYTKYNVWYYGSNSSAAWCAIFISWCANQAGIPTSIIRKNALASGYSVSTMRRNSFGAPAYAFGDTSALPGDIAYIDNNNDNVSNHVGLVYKVDSKYIHTVEGNYSNKVTTRKYSVSSGRPDGATRTRIVFFARPNYQGGSTALSIRTGQDTYRITQGDSCNVTGSISSGYDLTTVTAELDTGWFVNIFDIGRTSLDIESSKINSFRAAGLSSGTHTLTITASDKSGASVSKSVSIVVSPKLQIAFSPASLTLNLGDTKTLSIDYTFSSKVDAIAWDSSQFHIVTFSKERKFISAAPSGLGAWSLEVYGNKTGTEEIPFRLLDANGTVLHTASLSVTVQKVPSFSVTPPDVPTNVYYYDAVRWAVERDVIILFSQNFRPSEACTRASAVTFLWRLAGAPYPSSTRNPFTDVVPTDSYYNAALWALERGVTTGTSSDKFSPTAPCTRGQIVTFLHRFAGQPAATGVNSFRDVSDDSFCYHSVNWAASRRITEGYEDNTFRPGDTCTRAHIIAFIHRYATR